MVTKPKVFIAGFLSKIMVEDHGKISHTAALCARARARYTDMPYAREIAHEIREVKGDLPGIMRAAIYLFPDKMPQMTILEGRYAATNDALKRTGPYQILELAAGLAPRSLSLADGHAAYVETDLREMLGEKERIVRKIRAREGRAIGNHHFMPLNALDAEALSRAGEIFASHGNGEPIAVVHEGLFMYLSKAEQAQMRDNLAGFFRTYSPNGSWISPDLSYRPEDRESFIIRWAKNRIQKRTGREFTHFASQQEADEFFRQGGFAGETLPNEHVVGELTCVGKMGISPEKARRMAEKYRVCVAKLQS